MCARQRSAVECAVGVRGRESNSLREVTSSSVTVSQSLSVTVSHWERTRALQHCSTVVVALLFVCLFVCCCVALLLLLLLLLLLST